MTAWKKKKGQTLVRLKKNIEEGVLLLIGSFVVSLLTIKQGKVGCEWLLGECANHTEYYRNVLNKRRRKMFQHSLNRLFCFFKDTTVPDKCAEWWSTFQPQFGPNPSENWHQMPEGGKTNPEMSLFDWVPSNPKMSGLQTLRSTSTMKTVKFNTDGGIIRLFALHFW